MTKPTVGFYDLTGCNGCLLSFVFNEDEILHIAKHVDIKTFRFIKEKKDEKQYDVVFVEGLVASNEDIESIKSIREKTKILVALGACACTGCIPAYRNFIEPSKYVYLTYDKIKEINDVQPTPISMHVQVDYSIPGCPADKKQILEFIKDLVLGKKPHDYDRPVCFECRLNENRCLLDDNKMCLGPITRGGCNAICTNGKFECWGCRGPMPDANLPLISKLLEQKGFSKDAIKQRLRTFAALQMEKLPVQKPIVIKKKAVKKVKKPKKKLAKAKKKVAKKVLKPKKKIATKMAKKVVKKKIVKKKAAIKKTAKKMIEKTKTKTATQKKTKGSNNKKQKSLFGKLFKRLGK